MKVGKFHGAAIALLNGRTPSLAGSRSHKATFRSGEHPTGVWERPAARPPICPIQTGRFAS